jgi:hypothetical protein
VQGRSKRPARDLNPRASVMIHVVLPEETSSLDPRACDQVRENVDLALGKLYSNAVGDVIFTARSTDALIPDETNAG